MERRREREGSGKGEGKGEGEGRVGGGRGGDALHLYLVLLPLSPQQVKGEAECCLPSVNKTSCCCSACEVEGSW